MDFRTKRLRTLKSSILNFKTEIKILKQMHTAVHVRIEAYGTTLTANPIWPDITFNPLVDENFFSEFWVIYLQGKSLKSL